MRILVIISLVVFFLSPPASVAQQSARKKVLVLFAFRPTLPVSIQYDRGIRSVFEKNNSPKTVLNIEFMDLTHFADDSHARMLRDVYRVKYSKPRPDLIIAVAQTAVDFVLKYREDLFPGVPVVFGGVEKQFTKSRSLETNITGYLTGIAYTETLELALQLQPDTRNVVVYGDAGPIAKSLSQSCRDAYQAYEKRLNISYLMGLPMDDLLDKMSNLPERTVVFHLPFWRDSAGKEFVGNEALAMVAATANAPVYTFWDAAIGTGIVGGYLHNLEEEAKEVAKLGRRVLNGERPESIPIKPVPSFRYMVDWRQLKRWSISENRLPSSSVVKFKELSTWDKYKGRIVVTLFILTVQTLIILLLLHQRRLRRQTENELKDKLQFEGKLSELSSQFINLTSEKIDSKIFDVLSWIGPFMRADRSHMFRFNWDRTEFRITHLWEANGIKKDDFVFPGLVVKNTFPWLFENLKDGRDVIVPDIETLSTLEAGNEYQYCRELGIQSFIILPIELENAPLCAIGLDSIRQKREWSQEAQDRLRIIGEIIANTIVRRHAEKKFEEASLKYQTVADFTYDWEYWQNSDGSLLYVSPSCERICGYSAQELTTNPSLLQDMIVSEDKAGWDMHRCSVQNNTRSEEIYFRIQRRDGEIRWIEHVCQAVFDQKGKNQGIRASNRDITKRELYRSEAHKLRSELAHMERVVTISTLTAALAHEINQPLAAIRSYAQAALRFMDKDHPEYDSVQKALQGIVADNKRAAGVVNRLRNLVKKGPSHRERIEINSIINDVIDLINSEFVLRNASIRLELHPEVALIQGDSIQVQQVLINLLTNALDAMDDQPPDARTIAISTRLENSEEIIISISDSGGGIPPDKIEALFSPFHTTKPSGMGLGLSICKSIIEAHGGKIFAENNPDGGATFYLILPSAGS